LGAVLCCTAGGVVAAGLELLQADLANCPTLGSEGVLASVRVKDGRLVGTQGLVKQLRKQQGTRVPYKVRRGGAAGHSMHASTEYSAVQPVGESVSSSALVSEPAAHAVLPLVRTPKQ
jgi:hypothetical protein